MAGIVSEMPEHLGIEVGLKLREARLCNGILYSTEDWSSMSDAEVDRLEVVDTAMLRQLVDGHSKCNKIFVILNLPY